MRMQKLLIAGLLAATLGSAALPAAAWTHVDLYLNGAPPPARYEVLPAPRVGYLWAPGHWGWRGHHHVWIAGHWVRHRPGSYYEPARWANYDGRWGYHAPYWRPGDRDGDGVPDRYDRAPNNPYVR